MRMKDLLLLAIHYPIHHLLHLIEMNRGKQLLNNV
jgi:hypothetical protein